MNILEARRRLLDGEIKKRTAEGENISVRSVSRMKPGLTLYGKSEQRTTAGAQLANFPDAQEVENNGVTWSCENGVMHAAGTTADDKYSVFNSGAYIFSVVAGTYYVSASSDDVEVYVSVRKNEATQYYRNSSFTLDGTETECKIYAQVSPGKTVDETVYPMLNSGPTALPWEPYTGGTPSPSPDYPQEIKSVGDSGTVNVSLSDGGSQSQTLPVQTPNGLPGIPVDSGGNYTDANGQQWICDEVDFERGVYVQRIVRYTGPFYKMYWEQTDSCFVIATLSANIPKPSYRGFCNISDYYSSSWNNLGHSHWFLQTDGQQIVIHLGDTYNTEEAVEQFIEKNGIVVYYAAETPIETPLSPSELAAYSALRTYSPTTVVSNNAGAWMKLGYKTKKSLEVTD